MFRDHSLSRVSSRSLCKIKAKIDIAFSKSSRENIEQNKQPIRTIRSQSTQSLATLKSETPHTTIPFSIALKTGLISSERKKRNVEVASETQRKVEGLWFQKKVISCEREVKGEIIKGYAVYGKKQLLSVCKKTDDKMMRYFAVKDDKDKKVIAALEDNLLYVGSKQFMVLSSSNRGLPNKKELLQTDLKGSQFCMILNRSASDFCNLSNIISEVYSLIADGVYNLDSIINILGRKVQFFFEKNQKRKPEQLLIVLLLIQDRVEVYKKMDKKQQKRVEQ